MFREISAWRVTDELKKGVEIYAIRKGDEVTVKDAKSITLEEYTDEKNTFYVKWVEENE